MSCLTLNIPFGTWRSQILSFSIAKPVNIKGHWAARFCHNIRAVNISSIIATDAIWSLLGIWTYNWTYNSLSSFIGIFIIFIPLKFLILIHSEESQGWGNPPGMVRTQSPPPLCLDRLGFVQVCVVSLNMVVSSSSWGIPKLAGWCITHGKSHHVNRW